MIASTLPFSALAQSFREIEGISSRRETVVRLARLFRDDPADAAILIYLLQGRLGPPFAAPNLGFDEKRLAESIARASGSSIDAAWQCYKQRGDLGLVADELLRSSGSGVTVRDVHRRLCQIALTTGPGSNETRMTRFADLLCEVGGGAAWAVVRIANGSLRLGVGDATVLDALSVASRGDLGLRAALERAYSLCSDLGYVAQALLQEGPSGLARIHPTAGRPVLSALAERLPSPEEIVRRLGPVVAEPKYDGLRLQAHKDGDRIWLFTRRLEDVTTSFPDVERGVRRQVQANQAIIDGEVVGFDPRTDRLLPLQQTVRRRRKHNVDVMEAAYPIRYYAFDLLALDGRDLTTAPYAERSRRLREIVLPLADGTVVLTPQTPIDNPRELERFLEAMLARGMEGAVVKRPDAPYHAGTRQYNWVKLKREYARPLADTFDLVIVGYDLGRGKRSRLGIGSLLGAVYDAATDRYRTVTRVASGLSDDEWIHLRELLDSVRRPERAPRLDTQIVPDVWVEPRYVVEVIAGGISRSPLHTAGKTAAEPGYALRFPRVARLRFDRRPDDATTQAEVIQMYDAQRG